MGMWQMMVAAPRLSSTDSCSSTAIGGRTSVNIWTGQRGSGANGPLSLPNRAHSQPAGQTLVSFGFTLSPSPTTTTQSSQAYSQQTRTRQRHATTARMDYRPAGTERRMGGRRGGGERRCWEEGEGVGGRRGTDGRGWLFALEGQSISTTIDLSPIACQPSPPYHPRYSTCSGHTHTLAYWVDNNSCTRSTTSTTPTSRHKEMKKQK